MKSYRSNLLAMLVLAAALPAAAPAIEVQAVPGPVAEGKLSIPLGSLPVVVEEQVWDTKAEDRFNPLAGEPGEGRDRLLGVPVTPDPLAPFGFNPLQRTPSPLLTFEGTGNPTGCAGCSPPDTVGDVGPKHVAQMVNATKLTFYDKAGTLLFGPSNLSGFWSSGNCNGDEGDPVVVYDPLADRWVLVQFASPRDLCFAVSTSADPLGTYVVYDFQTSQFPDYFKVGVWRDAYYVTTNENNYSAWAIERAPMLTGAAARSLRANFNGSNFLMPADVDGIVAPPAGTPGYFYTFLDNSFHGGSDRIELYSFAVTWGATPTGTFSTAATMNIASFSYTVCNFFTLSCAPQSGTAQKVDVVSEWPMFRFAYRNYPGFQALVGTFTVNVGSSPPNGRAGIRWFELHKVGAASWALFQEGTYDPGASGFRYMGSVAQDYYGDLALGFTHSSASDFPSIRYATRLAGDPSGTLGTEVTMTSGSGSQTSSNRWGDYSAMAIDPADECTFWYTNEYYPVSAGSTWKTRIGAFRLPECNVVYVDNFETGGTTRWSSTSP